MSSYLTVKDGIYDPSKQFAFKNITEIPFVIHWNGKDIITVKPGETVKLPHHLAVKCTGELVDKIMIGEIHEEDVKGRKKDPYFRAPKSSSLGVPEARKVWEDQILRELGKDEEDPQVAMMRSQIRDELVKDLSAEKSAPVTAIHVNPEEFSEIKRK